MTVADRIKKRRESLGMTQIQLADKMGYKTKSSVSKIESSGDNVTLKIVERAAKALNVSPSYFMGWTDNPLEIHKETNPIKERVLMPTPPSKKENKDQKPDIDLSLSEQITSEESDAIIEDTFGGAYYALTEATQIAQELLGNKDLRALFDAARGVRPEDLRMATDMLKRFKETNPDG